MRNPEFLNTLQINSSLYPLLTHTHTYTIYILMNLYKKYPCFTPVLAIPRFKSYLYLMQRREQMLVIL